MSFSSDGKFLSCGGGAEADALISRYEWRPGRLERTYRHTNEALANWPFAKRADMQISSNGATMMMSDVDRSVILWDTETAEKKRSSRGSVRMSADGRRADGRGSDEGPVHEVEVGAFWMARVGKKWNLPGPRLKVAGWKILVPATFMDGRLLAVVAEPLRRRAFEKWRGAREFCAHAGARVIGLLIADAVHDADTIWPSVFVPASGGMTSFTRSTRRSPLVKVPLFSKNDAPGKHDVCELLVLVAEDFKRS